MIYIGLGATIIIQIAIMVIAKYGSIEKFIFSAPMMQIFYVVFHTRTALILIVFGWFSITVMHRKGIL